MQYIVNERLPPTTQITRCVDGGENQALLAALGN